MEKSQELIESGMKFKYRDNDRFWNGSESGGEGRGWGAAGPQRSVSSLAALSLRSACAHPVACAQPALRQRSACAQLLILRSACAQHALSLRSACAQPALSLRSSCGLCSACAQTALSLRSAPHPALSLRSACAQLLILRSACAQPVACAQPALSLRSACAQPALSSCSTYPATSRMTPPRPAPLQPAGGQIRLTDCRTKHGAAQGRAGQGRAVKGWPGRSLGNNTRRRPPFT